MDSAEETYISLCAGVGGLDLGLRLALPTAKCVCYVEREAFCIAHLVDKMAQGWLDTAPIWTDIKTFDGKPWRGKVRGLIGSYPCQPFSVTGKRRGEQDERHLWPFIKKLICEIRPDWCFFENVAGHLVLGSDVVLCDLAEIGYDAVWTVIAAGDVGATQPRKRLFVLAYAQSLDRGLQLQPGESRQAGVESLRIRKDVGDRNMARREKAGERQGQHTRNQSKKAGGSMVRELFPPFPENMRRWQQVLKGDISLKPATTDETVKSEICKLANELADRLDGGVSGGKIRPHKILWLLWEAYVEEALREKARRCWRIQTEGLLQQILHGASIQKTESIQRRLSQEGKAFEARVLCTLRDLGKITDSPCRWELVKQFAREHFDIVFKLPHETALETGRHNDKTGKTALQDMWEAIVQNQGEALQYLQNKKTARTTNRTGQLRALGNGVVPIQAAVAFCTLVDFAGRQH